MLLAIVFFLIGIYCLDTHQIADTIAQKKGLWHWMPVCACKDKQLVFSS